MLAFGMADDYVVKPFSVKQLVARMKAVLGRTNAEPFKTTSGELLIGNVVLDLQSHVAKRDGVEVQLTRLEFRIFSMLAANPGRVIPYSRLVEYAWVTTAATQPAQAHICHTDRSCRCPTARTGDPSAGSATASLSRRSGRESSRAAMNSSGGRQVHRSSSGSADRDRELHGVARGEAACRR